MKKLLVTLGLVAAVVSSLSALTPVKADGLQVLPQIVQPSLQGLNLHPVLSINPQLLLVRKAELTSQVFVFWGYHPIYNPNPVAGYPAIWCYVKNSGLKDSGWFQTLIRIRRYDAWGNVQILQGYMPMSLPVGHYSLVGFRIYAPYGLKQVFSYADATNVVPEYQETNNSDSVP